MASVVSAAAALAAAIAAAAAAAAWPPAAATVEATKVWTATFRVGEPQGPSSSASSASVSLSVGMEQLVALIRPVWSDQVGRKR